MALCACTSHSKHSHKPISELLERNAASSAAPSPLIPAKKPELVSDSLVYAFMSDYIDHTKYADIIEPQTTSACDSTDLDTYLANNRIHRKKNSNIIEIRPTIKVSKADYNFMKMQLRQFQRSNWDLLKLRTQIKVRRANSKSPYSMYLSYPLFSKDLKSAIITADDGVVGGTAMYTFHNGHWLDNGNEIPFGWIH